MKIGGSMETLNLESKTRSSSGRYLPEHIIEHIRLRLPPESVARFRCVAKSWLSPLHLSSIVIQSVSDPCDSDHTVPLLFTAANGFCFGSSAAIRRRMTLPEKLHSHSTELLASCDGLVFLCASRRFYYVINPLTSQCTSLPTPLFHDECSKSNFGFYFNRWTGNHCLFSIVGMPKGLPFTSEVLGLGSDSWVKLHASPPVNYVDLRHNPVNVNDFLYSMAYKESPSEHPVILAFDIRAELFKMMPTPPCWEEGEVMLDEENCFVGMGLVEIESRLGFYATSKDKNLMDVLRIVVWLVDDYEIKGWSKFYSVSCRQGCLLGPINYWRTTALYQNNGELLFLFDSHDRSFLVGCSMKSGKYYADQAITDWTSLYHPTLIYRESFTFLDSSCDKHKEMTINSKRRRLTISE